jgi:sensor domain CHASE-containing protein
LSAQEFLAIQYGIVKLSQFFDNHRVANFSISDDTSRSHALHSQAAIALDFIHSHMSHDMNALIVAESGRLLVRQCTLAVPVSQRTMPTLLEDQVMFDMATILSSRVA